MAGTRIGGMRSAESNIRQYGEDFYRRIGSMGGAKGRTGGFYANHELAKVAGRLGGLNGSRNNDYAFKRTSQWKKRYGKAYEELLKLQREAQRKRLELQA